MVGRHAAAVPPRRPRYDRPASVTLADGTELLGPYQGDGRAQAAFLVRRSDARMLEVSPLLYLVAANLDGVSTLEEVAGRVGTAYGRPVSAASVTYLIEHKLQPLGIIDTGRGRAPQTAPLFALNVRAGVVPPRLVRFAADRLRWLFVPPVVVAFLLALAGVDGWLLARHDLGGAVHHLLRQPALLLAVVALTLCAGLFHELGHAAASRYGGAQPGVIGAGIYLLWPVFFNDLNDSYRLTRRARLRCDLGGVYFNVVFTVALAAAYGVTGAPPLIVAIAVQHLVIAQQFVPFVRLDGYYIVSDLAGVPDLFARIRPTVRGLLSRGRPVPALADLTPRARAIVTTWVVTTVPMLAVLTVLLLVRVPALLAGAWDGLSSQGAVTLAAMSGGDVVGAALGLVQIAILAVPLAGLGVLLLRVLVMTAGRHRAHPRRLAPALVPRRAPMPVPRLQPLFLIASAVVVLVWTSSRSRARRRRSRR